LKKYKIIYADPPWEYRNSGIRGAAVNHYPLMKDRDIESLPIQKISDKNSILFLWATFPKIQEALNVIKAWGFKYKTVGFVWVKKNKDNSNFMGVGWYTRSNAEICLIGTKGNPPKRNHNISQIIEEFKGKHSEKPIIVKQRIVELVGDLTRVELFARKPRNVLFPDINFKGWDVWGNEVESDMELL